MRAAVLIALKDLKLRLRDKSAYLWGIVAPLALALVFSGVFGATDDASFSVDYAVVNLDEGPIAEAFVQSLEGAEDAGFSYHMVDSVEEAEDQVAVGSDAMAEEDAVRADAAYVLPEGFSETAQSGEGGEILVIGGRGQEFASQLAYSFAEAFASEIQSVEVAVRTAIHLDPSLGAQVQQLAATASQTENPITVEDIGASTKQLDAKTYLAAGMAVFFVFFTVQFGVSGLLEERRIGTMSRLLAAPIRRDTIIVGKMLTAFALGVVSLGILAVVTSVGLGADWGNPLGVAILIVAVVLAAMGILAIVGSVAKTHEQASNFQAIVSLVLAMLGGTFFPISQVGGAMETLSLATPHAWFLRGLGDLAGGELASIWPSVGALLAFGVVTGAVSWFFLRRAVAR
jgi:ABC-2 type transport system permease protein